MKYTNIKTNFEVRIIFKAPFTVDIASRLPFAFQLRNCDIDFVFIQTISKVNLEEDWIS